MLQDLEPAEPTEPAKPKTPEPESEEQREQKAKLQRKEQALQQKDQGNAAYKAKRFDEAIQHYDKAYELYDEDISFITNRWEAIEKRLYNMAMMQPNSRCMQCYDRTRHPEHAMQECILCCLKTRTLAAFCNTVFIGVHGSSKLQL